MHRQNVGFMLAMVVISGIQQVDAQVPAGPDSGVRVRVAASARPGAAVRKTVGTLLALRADSIVLEQQGSRKRISYARGSVQQLDISEGTKSALFKGMGKGALIGAVIGIGAGAAASAEPCNVYCAEPADAILVVGVAGTLAGMLVGAVIGSVSRTDRWTRVPVSPQATIQPLISNRSVGVRARIAMQP